MNRASRFLPSAALGALLLLCAGCSSSSNGGGDGGGSSCSSKGTLELTAGQYHGTSGVKTVSGGPSSSFLLLTDQCTGDATGSLYDIPSTVGVHSFTVATAGSGATATGPNLTLGLPGPDYTVGFDFVLDCAPCGTGTITVLESDATRVSGTFEGTAVQITGGPGGLGTLPSSTLPVSGTFEALWE